jgi:3-deoxy-D-manno-octulosonate cytidylyltransferase
VGTKRAVREGRLTSLAVIPARLGSSRIPGKPLRDLGGLPLIERVRRRVCLATQVDRVIVASDSHRVIEVVQEHGGEALLTGHSSCGTERVAAVANMLEDKPDFVLNVQGDMPLVDPVHIDLVIRELSLRAAKSGLANAQVVTLAVPLPDGEDPSDKALVKVTLDQAGRALYFSRAPIPMGGPWFVHLGIYGFSYEALRFCTSLPVGKLSVSEDLEQLRWLEAGVPIWISLVEGHPLAVDTLAQLSQLESHYHSSIEDLLG